MPDENERPKLDRQIRYPNNILIGAVAVVVVLLLAFLLFYVYYGPTT
ncbi:hypothetical protein [Deinococcus pimensis]|nr:hypothetical protein [Deinococcus pimensis]